MMPPADWMPADVGPAALWVMLLLGAYHGLNPGMGWLFAVALGLQAQKGGAVARALPPMALGHALAIAVVVLAAVLLGAALPLAALRVVVGARADRSWRLLARPPSSSPVGPHAGRLRRT